MTGKRKEEATDEVRDIRTLRGLANQVETILRSPPFDPFQGEAVLHAFGALHPPQGAPGALHQLAFQALGQIILQSALANLFNEVGKRLKPRVRCNSRQPGPQR